VPIHQTACQPAETLQRYVLIDLLRFVICLAIAIWHYQHFSYVGSSLTAFDVHQQPFYAWVRQFYENGGQFRVQLFWSISGFVLFLAYGRAIASRHIGWRKFFFERFARLYPLYLLSFGLVVVLQVIYLHRNGD
jgi:peptidoglycan/LPS O-acetylase OafA/YrhL